MQKYKIPLTVLLLMVTLYPMYSLYTHHDSNYTFGLAILAFYLISVIAPLTGFLWARSNRKPH